MSVDLLLLAVYVVLMLSAVRSNRVDRDEVCVLFVNLLLSAVYVSVLYSLRFNCVNQGVSISLVGIQPCESRRKILKVLLKRGAILL